MVVLHFYVVLQHSSFFTSLFDWVSEFYVSHVLNRFCNYVFQKFPFFFSTLFLGLMLSGCCSNGG